MRPVTVKRLIPDLHGSFLRGLEERRGIQQDQKRRKEREGEREADWFPRGRRQCKSLPMHHRAVNRSLLRDKLSRSSARTGPRPARREGEERRERERESGLFFSMCTTDMRACASCARPRPQNKIYTAVNGETMVTSAENRDSNRFTAVNLGWNGI